MIMSLINKEGKTFTKFKIGTKEILTHKPEFILTLCKLSMLTKNSRFYT